MSASLFKTITLRLTRAALNIVPDASDDAVYGASSRHFKKSYENPNRCLICQAIRLRFPNTGNVSVYPGCVHIDGVCFNYAEKHEPAIRKAHRSPRTFKPFAIRLTRQGL